MHVFLTGSLQVGKSTLIKKVLSSVRVPIGGFQTYFLESREYAGRTLYMSKAGTPEDARVVAQFTEGRPKADTGQFDSFGGGLLQDARQHAGLIIMDECGKLERDALIFQREILSALDGRTPVLGVVRIDAGNWAHAIHSHPKVLVLRVTEDNRDLLTAPLSRWLDCPDDTSIRKELEPHAYHD